MPFGDLANGGNRVPYAPLALDLMGLLPADSVPDFQIAVDPVVVDAPLGRFTASRIDTVHIRDLLRFPRGPGDPDARIEFRGIYVVVFARTAAAGGMGSIRSRRRAVHHPAPDDDPVVFNFWEVTGGRGTLQMDGILEFLLR